MSIHGIVQPLTECQLDLGTASTENSVTPSFYAVCLLGEL